MGIENVLVVEDEPGILSLCRRILPKAQYQVDVAATFEEGLNALNGIGQYAGLNRYQLLIFDVSPKKADGGIELARYAREIGYNGRIIMMTTNDLVPVKAKTACLTPGLQYLTKPFASIDHFLSAVKDSSISD